MNWLSQQQTDKLTVIAQKFHDAAAIWEIGPGDVVVASAAG